MQFDHFTIRPLAETDLILLYQMIDENRKRLEAFFSGTVLKTRTFADTGNYLTEVIEKSVSRVYLPFIVSDEVEKRFAGFIDIKNIDWNIPKGELGCFIGHQYEGKGIAGKAFSIFTSYCFTDLGFNKLFLRTHEHNISACRLAEATGFNIEGKLRKDYKTTDGELVDLLYYGRIA